jgi:hypothetical protein
MRVGLVERVADPVVVDRRDLVVGQVRASHGTGGGPFVDVVAKVYGEVQVLLGQMLVRVVEPVRIVLAGDERKLQGLHRPYGWRRLRAPDRAGLVADTKPVPVPPRRLQPFDLDVHGVPQFGHREHGAALHEALHALVGGDLPLHGNRMTGHAAAFERLRRQARPQHHAGGRGIARRHAERKRVVADLLRRRDARGSVWRQRRVQERRSRPGQKAAPAKEAHRWVELP